MAKLPSSKTLGILAPQNTANHSKLEALVRSLLKAPEGRVSMVASALFLADPILADAKRRMQPNAGFSVVHETQRFWRSEVFEAGEQMDVSFDVETSDETQQFLFRIMQASRITAEMETRLRFVQPEQMRGLKGARFLDRMGGPHPIEFSSRAILGNDVGAYVRLAHDDNPIHTDTGAARVAGLAGTVVPGMLLCAMTELAFGNCSSNVAISEMKTRFMAAVPVDEAVRLISVPRGASQDPWAKARVFCVTQNNVIAAISDIDAQLV